MTHRRSERHTDGPAAPRATPDQDGPVTVAYHGGAAFASVLVDCLEREGGVVQWEPPEAAPAGGLGVVAEVDAQLDVVAAVGRPLEEAVSAGIVRFRRRFPDRGSVKIRSISREKEER